MIAASCSICSKSSSTVTLSRDFAVGRDLRWVAAILYKNQTVEETGVAAGVLDHPANGVHWLANKIAAHGDSLPIAIDFTNTFAQAHGDVLLFVEFARPNQSRRR